LSYAKFDRPVPLLECELGAVDTAVGRGNACSPSSRDLEDLGHVGICIDALGKVHAKPQIFRLIKKPGFGINPAWRRSWAVDASTCAAACSSGHLLMADVIASRRESTCTGGSSAKPQGETRTKAASTTINGTNVLDIVCFICLTWIRQLKGQTNQVPAIEITGAYDGSASNGGLKFKPASKVLNNVEPYRLYLESL
jgi:hypothetical protein